MHETALHNAQTFLAEGDPHKAALSLILLAQEKTLDAVTLFDIATLLMLCDWLPEAQVCAERCLSLDPNFPHARWLYAGILSRRLGEGRHPELLSAYRIAHEAEPNNAYLCIEYADVLRTFEDYAQAQTLYARASETAEDEAVKVEAEFKQGCVLLTLGRETESREAFKRVLGIMPDHEEAKLFLGEKC
ncbi:MAG: hypothetical protein H7308_07170 [Chthonomonadaceae bacterium]|nr:hypothetical protein [Chthonomonadaceae bacterium]